MDKTLARLRQDAQKMFVPTEKTLLRKDLQGYVRRHTGLAWQKMFVPTAASVLNANKQSSQHQFVLQ